MNNLCLPRNNTIILNAGYISGTKPFQLQDVFSLESEDSDDTTTLIDNKVCTKCRNSWENLTIILLLDVIATSSLIVGIGRITSL